MSENALWRTITLHANGLTFRAIAAGKGPLILALHGFPDIPTTFRHQLPVLAAAGYRVVAPYMRGYAPSDVPPDGAFEIAALIQDTLAMIDQLTDDPAILIGHDFGSSAASGAARMAPAKVNRLITLAVPQGGTLSQALVANPAQQRRSWYMAFFQLSFAEAAVAHNDFAFLERLWQDWSPNWAYPPEEMAALKGTFCQPGVVKAGLNYYRSAFNPAYQHPDLADIRSRQREPVPVPTLYIHGANDGCIGVEVTDGMEKAYSSYFEKHIVPNAGHFVHQEQPSIVNRLILNFLKRKV
ncbi:MAG TPA: alpha/beta hydrolase [Aggregatilineaceae bacterium]|nr:alpha/beta hydrolase [Aggregatilineaceae bacterium]